MAIGYFDKNSIELALEIGKISNLFVRYARKGNFMKKRLALIATVLVGVLLIGATAFYIVHDFQKDKEQHYINEHASISAIVTEKHIGYGARGGYYFQVIAEHSSVTSDGEEITFTVDYSLPEESLKDYYQIEVGDYIVAEYTPYARSGEWNYVSFIKSE